MHAIVRIAMIVGALAPFAHAATGSAQGAAMPLPSEIEQCERSILKFCGQWTLNGGQYTASWSNGARAVMTVTRFDGHSIALHRVDAADSTSEGMTADYLGDVDGGKMKGKVTYTWPDHIPPVGYGTWDATFTPPAPQAAPPMTTGAVSNSQNVGSASAEDCPLPAVPLSWLDPSNKRSVGQLWKIDGGVLSYTDAIEHKPARYAIERPRFWKRWAACAPPQFKERIADVSGF